MNLSRSILGKIPKSAPASFSTIPRKSNRHKSAGSSPERQKARDRRDVTEGDVLMLYEASLVRDARGRI
jgi:hypothetical protein